MSGTGDEQAQKCYSPHWRDHDLDAGIGVQLNRDDATMRRAPATRERVMIRVVGFHEYCRSRFAASGWGATLASVLLVAGASLTVINSVHRLIRAVQSERGENIATMASGVGSIGMAGIVASALGWAVLAGVFARRTSRWTFAAVGVGISLTLLFELQVTDNYLLRIGVCLGSLFLYAAWAVAGGFMAMAQGIQHAFFACGLMEVARMVAALWATRLTSLDEPASVLLGISLCASISALLVLVRIVTFPIRAMPDLRCFRAERGGRGAETPRPPL